MLLLTSSGKNWFINQDVNIHKFIKTKSIFFRTKYLNKANLFEIKNLTSQSNLGRINQKIEWCVVNSNEINLIFHTFTIVSHCSWLIKISPKIMLDIRVEKAKNKGSYRKENRKAKKRKTLPKTLSQLPVSLSLSHLV